MKKLIVGIAIAVSLLAIWRIGSSVYQYDQWQKRHVSPQIRPDAQPQPRPDPRRELIRI